MLDAIFLNINNVMVCPGSTVHGRTSCQEEKELAVQDNADVHFTHQCIIGTERTSHFRRRVALALGLRA